MIILFIVVGGPVAQRHYGGSRDFGQRGPAA